MTIPQTAKPLPRSAPEAQGIASSAIQAFIEEADSAIHELHSFMLLRHGQVIAEGWWPPYGAQLPHMLFSLSKSFTSTAAGLAIGEGKLSLDDTVISFFPDDLPAEVSENLAAMRVRHLLAMSTGHAEDTTRYLREGEDDNWVKGFLARPVEYAPGTHFLYNTGATYMVSAIVQKLTGMTLTDYLTPRLFEPLGITGAFWESCPRGVNVGGWGLNVKTEDIAKFGQLYLRKGVWEGTRLLPQGWVEQASAFHTPNGDNPESDWNQGYGFQFWRCRHNAYRGDGAFGQYCVVMPDQDAVVAITGGLGDMQEPLSLIWKHLLPAFQSGALPENAAAQEQLCGRLAALRLKTPDGAPTSPVAAEVSGVTFGFEPNDQKAEAVKLEFRGEECTITTTRDGAEHSVAVGARGEWAKGETRYDSDVPRKVAATGAWIAANTYTVKLCLYETPFCPVMTFRFDGDRLFFRFQPNVGFDNPDRPEIEGKRQRT